MVCSIDSINSRDSNGSSSNSSRNTSILVAALTTSEWGFLIWTAPKNRAPYQRAKSLKRPTDRDFQNTPSTTSKKESQTNLSGPISTADHQHSGRAAAKDSTSQRGAHAERKRGLRSGARREAWKRWWWCCVVVVADRFFPFSSAAAAAAAAVRYTPSATGRGEE